MALRIAQRNGLNGQRFHVNASTRTSALHNSHTTPLVSTLTIHYTPHNSNSNNNTHNTNGRELHIDLHGGRSSVSGVVATVFGATGFVGRYVVNRLGKIGSQVVVPYRGEEWQFRHLKLMGDLGQIVPMWYDVRDKETVRRAVSHSNVVINLVGKHWKTRNFSFDAVNHIAPATIAEVAAECGVERLIHISASGASLDSTSEFGRTKALGEKAVLERFPNATILRPTVVFGRQDRFLNRYARMARFWPIFPALFPEKLVQPLHVSDLASAVMAALAQPDTQGKILTIGGPKVYNFTDIYDLIQDETLLPFHRRNVPIPLIKAAAALGEKVFFNPLLVADELEYLNTHDPVVPEGTANALDMLETKPTRIEDFALAHLRFYRKPGFLNLIE